VRRRDYGFLVLVAVAAFAGCAPTPPPQVAPGQFVVRAPFDSVWSAAVAYFRERQLTLDTVDRAHGRLTTRAITLSGADSARWIECGKAKGLSGRLVSSELLAVFKVHVTDYRDSVGLGVGVTADWIYAYTLPNLPSSPLLNIVKCASNGAFEAGLVERVSAQHIP